MPLLVLVWQARRFRRRDMGPGASKGAFSGAVPVTTAFVVAMALVIAVAGPLISRAGAVRLREQAAAASAARSKALLKVADEVSAILPKYSSSEVR